MFSLTQKELVEIWWVKIHYFFLTTHLQYNVQSVFVKNKYLINVVIFAHKRQIIALELIDDTFEKTHNAQIFCDTTV
jgi:hypothetical protein